MVVYVVTMFLSAALFGVIGVLIYRGKTELIHDYHREKVTDSAAYGKAFGKAMGILSGALAVSGAIALLGEKAILPAVIELLLGLTVGMIAFIRIQKKFNGGIF